MRHHELYEALHEQPFEPFRIVLTTGESHVIRHPDFAWLTRTSVLIGRSSERHDVPDRFNRYDLLHVVGIEPVNGAKRTRRRKRDQRS
jgi:hypothetical protein